MEEEQGKVKKDGEEPEQGHKQDHEVQQRKRKWRATVNEKNGLNLSDCLQYNSDMSQIRIESGPFIGVVLAIRRSWRLEGYKSLPVRESVH
jgi:hypothetical protein